MYTCQNFPECGKTEACDEKIYSPGMKNMMGKPFADRHDDSTASNDVAKFVFGSHKPSANT